MTFVEPTIGRIVIYHSRDHVDMPAIVTALGPVDGDAIQRRVFLYPFPPPGSGPDYVDREWGVPWDADEAEFGPEPGCWRWPDLPCAARPVLGEERA